MKQLFVTAGLLAIGTAAHATPFGFTVENLADPSNECSQYPTFTACTSAPNPHPDMIQYLVESYDVAGICLTQANTDYAGPGSTRTLARSLVAQISAKYGPWTYGQAETSAYYWATPANASKISNISLSIHAVPWHPGETYISVIFVDNSPACKTAKTKADSEAAKLANDKASALRQKKIDSF